MGWRMMVGQEVEVGLQVELEGLAMEVEVQAWTWGAWRMLMMVM
jgi:hypothetical protein